jgi:2-polyprenyl-6-methoxyphenol hydroxylase-like FAD-dependent oxidoreductase
MTGILVNHSIDNNGTFVLHVPNYEPLLDLMEVYSARDLIGMMFEFGSESLLSDLEVVHVGKWKVEGVVADSMYQKGIFLAGDAAHAFPPAGGFGMNAGFQDINELVHTLFSQAKNKEIKS